MMACKLGGKLFPTMKSLDGVNKKNDEITKKREK